MADCFIMGPQLKQLYHGTKTLEWDGFTDAVLRSSHVPVGRADRVVGYNLTFQ